MLDNLPDHVVLKILSNLNYGDLLRLDLVANRYKQLASIVWSRKREIVFPYDLLSVSRQFSFSSYWDKFGDETTTIIKHCPNLKRLNFKPFRRLQIFLQSPSFLYFTDFANLLITEIHFGRLYVTDKFVFEIMATVFIFLNKLTIEEPYPLVHTLRADTMAYLQSRFVNLQPGLDLLAQDNNRVSEDLRFLLQMFPLLQTLKLKDVTFVVTNVNL